MLFGPGQHVFKGHHRGVATLGELSVFVENIGYAATHAGGEVTTSFTKDRNRATRHVFASMVAGALHNSGCTRQTHGKTLARYAAKKRFARGSAIQGGVADDGVVGRGSAEVDAWTHHNTPAAQALAGVIVGVAN